MPARILSIIGARPQFIKAAPVSRIFLDVPEIEEVLVHTGQHFDDNMSTVFFQELSIPTPAYNLDVHGGGHGQMTGRMMEKLEAVVAEQKPHAVLVYGDTNTTLAGALVASKLQIPVIHVEAGLRSFNRGMPEEINRVVADHLSSLLFCPTRKAVCNLEKEGVTEGVYHVGDVMYDATIYAREIALRTSCVMEKNSLNDGDYALCTLHRAENTDDLDRFRRLMHFIETAARERQIVFPVHPRTRGILEKTDMKFEGLKLIEPVGYFDIHRLLGGAALVYTDSGGLQKEAYFHRVPCVTLRDETEWVETIEAGWNRLWTVEDYAPQREINEYGEGQASQNIIDIIANNLT